MNIVITDKKVEEIIAENTQRHEKIISQMNTFKARQEYGGSTHDILVLFGAICLQKQKTFEKDLVKYGREKAFERNFDLNIISIDQGQYGLDLECAEVTIQTTLSYQQLFDLMMKVDHKHDFNAHRLWQTLNTVEDYDGDFTPMYEAWLGYPVR